MLWKAESKFTLQQCAQPTMRERKNVPSIFQRTLETWMGIVTVVYGTQFITTMWNAWGVIALYLRHTLFLHYSVSHCSMPQKKTRLFALTCAYRMIFFKCLQFKKKKKTTTTWSVSLDLCFVTHNCLGKQKSLNCFSFSLEVCVSGPPEETGSLSCILVFTNFWGKISGC